MDTERRVKLRYPLHLNVRYQTLGAVSRVADVGETVNLSSSGVLIASTCPIGEGERVRAVIEWPSLLNGTIPLQLVTIGIVVRRQNARLAIAFEGYQFRTSARRANVATMPEPRSTMPEPRSSSPYYHGLDVANLQIAAKSVG
jgi:hypothetical protein